jgi:hypothetical protein
VSHLGGRGGRPDDWASPHARARARAAERLDAPLAAAEEVWLDDHLSRCPDCATIAGQYATQRRDLRALREFAPTPPRDLWARTAASIERESRHRALTRRGGSRASLLAPYALLAGALVVAVVIGSLSSSQLTPGAVTTTPAPRSASATPPTVATNATPFAVSAKEVPVVSSEHNGNYSVEDLKVDKVCPESEPACATPGPGTKRAIGPLSSPEAIYESGDGQLIVVGYTDEGSSIVVLSGDAAAPTERPTRSPSVDPAESSPTAASPDDSAGPSQKPTPSDASPVDTSGDESIEIARDIEVIDSTAAYSPDGSAFAFTAIPADGSHGPDIYLWRTGEEEAVAITDDHRSVFGSWSEDDIAGSVVSNEGDRTEPAAFVLDAKSMKRSLRPETGNVWRPTVDPSGAVAVYWAGTLDKDGDHWSTDAGNLVLGRWRSGGDTAGSNASATPLTTNQAEERDETVIAEGPLADWDARWDETGTRLAIWIADPQDASVGRLSLYVVDAGDGSIDLASPPLADEPARAGFSIADGRLAWAVPSGDSGKSNRVKILAWSDAGFGKVETTTGDVLLVR